MPRVKALTTGSVPSFLDLILNFAESDTSSSLAAQDTWLAQLRAARGGKLVFYGDDTWLKLFPDNTPPPLTIQDGEGEGKGGDGGGDKFWLRHDGTSSFFVSVSRTGPGNTPSVEPIAEYQPLFPLRRISPK